MTGQLNIDNFEEIFNKTYSDILNYVIIKCHNLNEVNDILQETYLELWKILNKKDIENNNIKSFIISIANNKIKKHYTLVQKLNSISLFLENKNDIELIETMKNDIDIEKIIIRNDEWDRIWYYLKQKKNQDIPKIFYLHYKLDLSIKEIATVLNKSESYIKNLIYRTLKELSFHFGKEHN